MIEARPSEPESSHPLQSRRIPGAGALLESWDRVAQTFDDVFALEGVLISDNAGFPKEGAGVYLGNLEESRTLRLLMTTGAEGKFAIVVDNRTAKQLAKAGYYLLRRDREDPPREVIYRRNMYLYFGAPGVDLVRYRIPYESAVDERKAPPAG